MVQPVSNLTNVTHEVQFSKWRVIKRRDMLDANLSGNEWSLNNHNVTFVPTTGFTTDTWKTTESEPFYANYTVDAMTFYIYIGFYFLYVILSFLSDTIFSGMLYNASLSFHRRMLKSVINAKVSFFDKTPAGKHLLINIILRCT